MLEFIGESENLQSKVEITSSEALYRDKRKGRSHPAQILRKNIICWIDGPPLDARDRTPPEVINSAS